MFLVNGSYLSLYVKTSLTHKSAPVLHRCPPATYLCACVPQDAQEFLRCFLDQLHEELKEPSGPTPGAGRPRSPPVATSDSSPSEDEGDEEEEDFETCDSGLSSEKSSCGEEGAPDLRLLAPSHDRLAKVGARRPHARGLKTRRLLVCGAV